jgi:hypothetical protein
MLGYPWSVSGGIGMRILATVAISALLGFSTLAAAEKPAVPVVPTAAAKCLCVLQADAGPKVGILQDIRGQVLVADAAGYTPVKSGAELSIGDRIILLGGGKAKLAAGPTCQKQLASGSIVSIVANEKNVCISQALRVTAAADLPPPPEEEDDDLLGLLLFGASAAAGGISIFLLTRDGDRDRDRDRPVSP